MAERPFEIPVLIVGGGPVGLACSLMLTRFGVRSLLVERHPSTSRHPKAMAIMQRTAELLRQWGVVDAMRTAGVPQDWLRQILFAKSLTGEAFGTVEVDRPTSRSTSARRRRSAVRRPRPRRSCARRPRAAASARCASGSR